MIFNYSHICLIFFILNISLYCKYCLARKHHLIIQDDIRRYFPVSTFGYFAGGSLTVKVERFKFHPNYMDELTVHNQFGFTLTRTLNNNILPYIEGHHNQHSCFLNNEIDYFTDNIGLITMRMDFKNNKVSLDCNSQLSNLPIFSNNNSMMRAKRAPPNLLDLTQNKTEMNVKNFTEFTELPKSKLNDSRLKQNEQSENIVNVAQANKQDLEEAKREPVDTQKDSKDDSNPKEKVPKVSLTTESSKKTCLLSSFNMVRTADSNGDEEFSFQFDVYVSDPSFEGLYALYFHNCLNYPSKILQLHQYASIDLEMSIIEKNSDGYLSAGEIPLPQLYFALSVIFFILGGIWFFSIHNRPNETLKIHYLMGVLVFVKAISLLFHGINYHFIAKEGSQVETWAVLYYVTHFLKGALLIITIVLIGTGWAFIKHILSDKDKKIFMIVIPLQVIANIADIITEESEEGALIHTVWREIFISVDMLCCGAILFPIIWSIRHLSEASATDGKAAINLKKLQLFRFFYVMMVVYIYFTRIIVFLLKIAVPFKYEWLDAFFQHGGTLIFFILTGYHFQPTSSNPYYQLLQEDIEMDEEVLFIQPSTFSEAKKRNRDLETSDMQSLISRGTAGGSTHDYD